jgi:hypothetical protein
MDGTGEHHLKWSYPGTEGKKSYVLPHMQIIDLNAVILLDIDHTLRGECTQKE